MGVGLSYHLLSVGTSVRPTTTQRGSVQHLCVGIGQTGVCHGQTFAHRSDLCRGEPTKDLRTSPGQDPVETAHVRLLFGRQGHLERPQST
jgi:hypothetical protein